MSQLYEETEHKAKQALTISHENVPGEWSKIIRIQPECEWN